MGYNFSLYFSEDINCMFLGDFYASCINVAVTVFFACVSFLK